jgi:hypothetical protein
MACRSRLLNSILRERCSLSTQKTHTRIHPPMESAFWTCNAKNDGLGTAAAEPASHPWLRGPVAFIWAARKMSYPGAMHLSRRRPSSVVVVDCGGGTIPQMLFIFVFRAHATRFLCSHRYTLDRQKILLPAFARPDDFIFNAFELCRRASERARANPSDLLRPFIHFCWRLPWIWLTPLSTATPLIDSVKLMEM